MVVVELGVVEDVGIDVEVVGGIGVVEVVVVGVGFVVDVEELEGVVVGAGSGWVSGTVGSSKREK